MIPSANNEKKNMDVRLQYILSLIVGFAFLYLCGSVGQYLAARFASYVVVSAVVMNRFLNLITILFVITGIIFAMVLYRQPAQKRASTNRISMIVFLALQVLLILALLVLGAPIASLYIENAEIIAAVIPALRTAAIPMILLTIVSVVVGLIVKRKSFLLILVADIIVFVLSLIFMFVGAYILHWGLNGIAIGLGIMQPVAALLPNIGGWQFGNEAQGSFSTATQIRSDGDSNHAVAQMFCPQCGARFSAEKKYCDQCGTELSVLVQPEATTSHPADSNVQDAPSGGFAVLGFFIPLVGLILFLVWHDSYPLRAKSAGKGALAGVITSVVLAVLSVVIQMVFLSSLF